MQKAISFIKKNYFYIAIIIIIALGFILRFYDYPNRYAMGPDQAHFAVQAKYSLENFKLPMLGPFASGGPFQTGGEWYWFIMAGYLIFPGPIAPWIFLTVTNILLIIFLIYFAKELINEKFALIVGLIAAISSAQITQSINLTNQSPISIFSALALFFSYKLLKTKEAIFAFLLGFMISTAASIHLQGIALIPIIFITFIIGKIKDVKKIFYCLVGLFIPWIPVLFKDSENSYTNTRNMINYYLFNESPIPFEALGRRWLTFVFDFIPDAWANVIGGNFIIAYAFILISIVIFLLLLIKKEIKPEWIIMYFTLLIAVIILRYTRAPIFYSYMVFLHPIIILISSFAIYKTFIFNKFLGLAFFALVIIFTMQANMIEIKNTSISKSYYFDFIKIIEEKYPNDKFTFYDYEYDTSGLTLPILFYLNNKEKISFDGIKIGVAMNNKKNKKLVKYEKILGSAPGHIELYNLNKYSKESLEKEGWDSITPEGFYQQTQNWYK